MDQLLQEMIRFFERWAKASGPGSAEVDQLLSHMRSLHFATAPAPNMKPIVAEWFDIAVQGSTSTLVDLLLEHVDQLTWTTVPEDYLGKEFSQQFAFARLIGLGEIAGKPAIFQTKYMAAGFSLQAPNLFYPPHNHKAIEFYSPLSGTARWQLGNTAPQPQSPGSYIFHDRDVPHAMETADEPLLCLWAWIGDLDSPIEVPSLTWLEAS